MSTQVAQLAIADHSRIAKTSLAQLLSHVKNKAPDSKLTIQPSSIEDLLDKFNLWTGSLGALQAPSKKLSLDYRLQDALDIRDQICEYLENLQEAIQDLTSIITGDSPNRDIHEGSDDEDEAVDPDDSPQDEAQMILEVVAQCMRSLFRMAVLIRQAGPEDRFKRAMQHNELAFPESFDIEHVEQKHAKLAQHDSRWLAKRLGSAMAKRRQFIKYCREHKARLGVDNIDFSIEVDVKTEHLSSKATTFVRTRYVNADFLQAQLEESNEIASLMTASTAFDANTLQRLPRLKDLSPDGQAFECPICFTLQDFLREKAWKMHAFRDLKSYVCTFQDEQCRNELFDDRNAWFEHELQCHRSQYTCALCGESSFPSKPDLESHITSSHGPFPPDQLSLIISTGRQVPTAFDAQDCPFCNDWAELLRCREDPKGKSVTGRGGSILVSPTRFKRHVATHQEQLAIFSMPRSNEKIGSASSGSTHSVSRDLSAQASDDAGYQNPLSDEPLVWTEEENTFDTDFNEPSDSERQPLTEARLKLATDRSETPSESWSFSSSSSSSQDAGEYPKKGKTRIPERLVNRRALIDLAYPFVEEGNTIVVLKALGQENIDDLLKLSEEYRKSDTEVSSGDVQVSQSNPYLTIRPLPGSREHISAAQIMEAANLRSEIELGQPRRDDPPGIDAQPEDNAGKDTEDEIRVVETIKKYRSTRHLDRTSSTNLNFEHGKTDDKWTEITKDLVTREALEESGYEYEETEYFFYVMAYLSRDEIVELVRLSNIAPPHQQDKQYNIVDMKNTGALSQSYTSNARDTSTIEKMVPPAFGGLEAIGDRNVASTLLTQQPKMRRRSF